MNSFLKTGCAIFTFCCVLVMPIVPSLSTLDKYELLIQNASQLNRSQLIVPIEIPEMHRSNYISVTQDSEILPSHVIDEGSKLMVQLDLEANKESSLEINFSRYPQKGIPLTPSTQPGTLYFLENFQRLYIISTQEQNEIKILTSDEDLLEKILLQKGELHTLRSNAPQLVVLESKYPVYLFLSSIGDGSQGNEKKMETGDSDTTTLFGSDLFFYTYRHLWISCYEETSITLYNDSGFVAHQEKLSKNSGIFLGDLTPGVFRLVSDYPITIQFGHLDDENYSFIHGKSNQINGFAFGNLLLTSLHPETSIELSYSNPRRQQKKILFKNQGDFELIPLIDLFKQYEPEYLFFTLSFNKPLLVNTFSSGTNFGGDFVPGYHGLFLDTDFKYLTPNLAQEFSKEQRNMVGTLGVYPNTSIAFKGGIEQEVLIQRYTHFHILSNESLSWLEINSKRPFLLAQLHNYTQKGLFSWVPPIADTSIITAFGDPVSSSTVEAKDSWISSINISVFRCKEFISNLKEKEYGLFLIFFLSFLFLLLIMFLLALFSKKQTPGENFSFPVPEKMEDTELMKLMHQMENKMSTKEKAPFALDGSENIIPIQNEAPKKESTDEEKIPTKTIQIYPKLNISYESLLQKLNENIPSSVHDNLPIEPPDKEEIPEYMKKDAILRDVELPFLDVDHTRSSDDFSIIHGEKSTISALYDKKVILDPGSANRLYMEGILGNFTYIYMVKSSAKRLQPNIAKLINQIELNLQDLSKSQLFQERLETLEEAGKALTLCKKKRIFLYISSYKLPATIQKIQILQVSELLKDIS